MLKDIILHRKVVEGLTKHIKLLLLDIIYCLLQQSFNLSLV
jgi:hypothetical protein